MGAWKQYRLRMPHFEVQYPWLSLLLDSYAVVDWSVQDAIANSGKAIACRKGCEECCHQLIPASTLEVMGIKLYLEHVLTKAECATLQKNYSNDGSCIFNTGSRCVVYHVRPFACRRYMVANMCCKPHEDATKTRPFDIIEPSRELLYHAISLTLPYYAAQGLAPQNGEHLYAFYLRQNVALSDTYPQLFGNI